MSPRLKRPGAPSASQCGSSWGREGHDGGQNVDLFQGPYDFSALTFAHHDPRPRQSRQGYGDPSLSRRPLHLLSYIHAVSLCLPTRSFLPSVTVPLLFSLVSFFVVLSFVVVFGHNILPRLVLPYTLYSASRFRYLPVTLFDDNLSSFSQNISHIQNAILNIRPCRSREPSNRYVDSERKKGPRISGKR
jgi:hypothetical protein